MDRQPEALMTFPNEDLPPQLADHYILGLAHRRRILSALPHGGRMLEWGSGDSTFWFRENMRKDQTLISIENDVHWAARTEAFCAGGPAGRNATIAEETPTPRTWEYVWQEPWVKARQRADNNGGTPFGYDVILVDGVWRNLCLFAAAVMLTHTGVVFLHDAERDWYTTGMLLYPIRIDCGMCSDYAHAQLMELRFR